MANLLTTTEKVRVAREIDSANACREVGQRMLRGQKVGFGLWRRASRDTVQLFGVPPGRHKRGFASGVPGAHVMAKVHQPANKQRIRFANYDDSPSFALATSTFGRQSESRQKSAPEFSFRKGASNASSSRKNGRRDARAVQAAKSDIREYPTAQSAMGTQVQGRYRTSAALTMAKTARFPPAD